MIDVSSFYRSLEFHDASLLLTSDSQPFQQGHVASSGTAARSWRASSSRKADRSCTAASDCLIEHVPVHQLVLSAGSDYLRAAIALIKQDPVRLGQPVIVLHEEDVNAAHGVLQFLYTQVLNSRFTTAPELLSVMLVSKAVSPLGGVGRNCGAMIVALHNSKSDMANVNLSFENGQQTGV